MYAMYMAVISNPLQQKGKRREENRRSINGSNFVPGKTSR